MSYKGTKGGAPGGKEGKPPKAALRYLASFIRRHRPVSGVSDSGSQMAKRRLRRLALLTPRGPTFGTFVAHFGDPVTGGSPKLLTPLARSGSTFSQK